jgi:DNA-binding MltR family transcriptional regulator
MKTKSFSIKAFDGVWETFKTESDRSCAIIGGSITETVVMQTIKAFMIKDHKDNLFSGFGPLSTFSSKIELAYNLGLIPPCAYTELNLIRKIRNFFAHDLNPELSLSKSPIRDFVMSLQYSKMYRDLFIGRNDLESKETIRIFDTFPRSRFELSVGLLSGILTANIKSLRRRKSPKGVVAAFDPLIQRIKKKAQQDAAANP